MLTSLKTLTLTVVFAFPFNLFEASSLVKLYVDSPSISIILSFGFIPALYAGPSSTGETTVKGSPTFFCITIPTPTYLPFISS